MTYYYLNPEPEKIFSAIQYLSDHNILDDNKAFPPTLGFLSGIFNENESQVTQWMESSNTLPDSKYRVLVLSLWYANLTNSKTRVHGILQKRQALMDDFNIFFESNPISVTEIPLEKGPWVLDSLWGNFMATGKKEPVARIIEALPWFNVKGDWNRLMIGKAAAWSLTSNAIQHKKVIDICEIERINQTQDIADKLDKIVTTARKKLLTKTSTDN
ncbi:hypothetical protein [Candidatus Nitrospira allomarina]|uniref:Uncharacterized protein n=1 Tax=Candidatus Nitrospira allomarina TaxID=3020900 RepID=A0AA96JS66_9BACT|nr:hypothetical protein [Candidatus Nitrospira allomarina]WNM58287.1 hypothetical protein PP769_00575 [Candidatus Nitrospira allomarina]